MRDFNRKLDIKTPEGVHFYHALATPGLRAAAVVIDYFCVMILLQISAYIINLILFFNGDLQTAMRIIIFFIISILYPVVMEWFFKGQTIGKKIFSLKVIDIDGQKLKPAQIIIRNLLRAVDILPAAYLVGGITSFISSKYQRLGDIAAQTCVIRIIKVNQPDISSIMPDKYNSFRDFPNLEFRIRNKVSPEFAMILIQALLRRNSLNADARIKIYSNLVEILNEYVNYPEGLVEGLSDERCLRNTVDVLYNRPISF